MGRKLFVIDVQPQFGWDIAGSRNLGYLATRGPRGRDGAGLYTVDPTTGNSRLVGRIGGNRLSRGLAITGLAVDQSAPS